MEHNYYEARMASGGKIYQSDLCDAINEYGARQTQEAHARYECATESWTEVVVDSWARGPQLRLTCHDGDGGTEKPTIGNGLVTAILDFGYVPWGFRPDSRETRDSEWLWYFRPVKDVEDGGYHDTEYALKRLDDGQYLLGDENRLLTFDNEGDARAVMMAALEEHEVVEVPSR